MSNRPLLPKVPEPTSQKGSAPAAFPGYEPGHEPNVAEGTGNFRDRDGRPINQSQTPNDDDEEEEGEGEGEGEEGEAAGSTDQPPAPQFTCPTCNGKFKTRTTLRRHVQTIHEHPQKIVYEIRANVFCPVTGCPFASGHGFAEHENLDRHLRWVHFGYRTG
jgi:hypothetical protein